MTGELIRFLRAICVLLAFALAFALALAPSLPAQASVTVSPADQAYRDLDRLAAAGLVDTVLFGQRPWSRREIARMVAGARRNATTTDPSRVNAELRETLGVLEERFSGDLDAARDGPSRRWIGIERVDLSVTSTDGAPRAAPPDTGIGGVDAVVAPLAQHDQQGRDAMRGTTLALEALATMSLGAPLAVQAQPRLRLSTGEPVTHEPRLSMRTLAARARFSNFVVSVGRDYLEWGQGRHAGLFLSRNARALDMIWVGTERPTILPWWFRKLGPSRLSLFVADLGPRQFFPHTMLGGYKLSASPSRDLEFGVSVLDFTGGRGSPPASVFRRIENLFIFPLLRLKGFQFSNLMAGLEVRYHVRAHGDAQVYWEVNFDDFDPKRMGSVAWTDDGAHVLGMSLPRLAADGRLALSAEFHHTGTRFGRHLQFQSGAASEQFLLGDPLGPDADGGYLFLDWRPRRGSTVSVELAHEAYRANQHTIVSQDPFVIRTFAVRPQERRSRAIGSLRHAPATFGFALDAQAGIEHTTRSGFVDGATRTSALGSVGLRYLFR